MSLKRDFVETGLINGVHLKAMKHSVKLRFRGQLSATRIQEESMHSLFKLKKRQSLDDFLENNPQLKQKVDENSATVNVAGVVIIK